jgi:drug/metabolite transporter (DMT)-like permease
MIRSLAASRTFHFFIMFLAMMVWGVSWPIGKIAAEHAAPDVAAFWRYTISLFSFLPVMLLMKPSYRMETGGVVITVIAGVLTGAFNWLFFAGLSHGLAGYGGTIVTTMAPVLTFVLSVLIFRTRVKKMQLLGILTGLAGGAVLLKLPEDAANLMNVGVLYFVIAALVWALVTLATQRAVKKIDVLLFTLIVFAVTALINLYVALPYHPFAVAAFGRTFWESIFFVGIAGGTFSTTVYFLSSGKLGASVTAIYLFLVPVGDIVSSYFIFDEIPAVPTVAGCVLAFVAVFLFNFAGEARQTG